MLYHLLPSSPLPPVSLADMPEAVRQVLFLCSIVLALVVVCKLFRYIRRRKQYNASDYAQNTNKTMRQALSDKGSRGEYELYLQTAKRLKDEAYWLFNVYVPCANGGTTEIDAILFHASGIYIIESKNYGGWIYGNEHQERWTQCLKPGRHSPVQKYTFYNPVKQNQAHVDCFKAWLGERYSHIPIYSVILFGNHCTLKKIRLSSDSHIVNYQYNFPSIVKSIAATTSFSNIAWVKNAYQIAYPLSQADPTTKAKHTDDIRAAQKHPAYKEQTLYSTPVTPPAPAAEIHGRCPLCNGTLMTRIAKKGSNPGTRFIGCSNFPGCRYTKNIDEEHT